MTEEETFRDLIQRIRAGDQQAAAELVHRYEAEIRRAVQSAFRNARRNDPQITAAGAQNLLDQPEFHDLRKLRSILRIVEEQKVLYDLIAEDLALLREGVVALLRENEIDVVAQVQDGPALLRAIAGHEPDLAIVDVRLPPTFSDEGLLAAILGERDDGAPAPMRSPSAP